MLGDAHSTNYAENRQFFLNQNNPANFERTWNTAYLPLPADRRDHAPPVPFDQVMDFSIIQKLGDEETYKTQQERIPGPASRPRPSRRIRAEGDEILTKTVVIHFFPNSWDLHKKVTKRDRRQGRRGALRPQRRLRARGGRQARRPVRRRPASSSRATPTLDEGPGQPADLVKELSLQPRQRGQGGAGQEVHDLDPNQFAADGVGWDRPADPERPATTTPRTAASRSRSTRPKAK